MAFLVFTHVNTGHGIFIIKQVFCHAFANSVLPTPVVQGRKSSYWFSHVL
jgi:hypothetical protein